MTLVNWNLRRGWKLSHKWWDVRGSKACGVSANYSGCIKGSDWLCYDVRAGGWPLQGGLLS